MRLTRRRAGLLVIVGGALVATYPLVAGQERAPNRPEVTLTARNFTFVPDRIEVSQDDLVRVTINSEDNAYSFAIDEYRIARRVPRTASGALRLTSAATSLARSSRRSCATTSETRPRS